MRKHASSAESTAPVFPFPISQVPSSDFADAVARSSEAYRKACLAWQEEVVRFANDRLKQDSQLRQAMFESGNWADLVKAQQQWALTTVQDYLNESSRLMQMASRIVHDGMEPLREASAASAERATAAAKRD